MGKYFRTIILVLTASIFGVVNAFAGSFSGRDVEKVIHAMRQMDGEKLPKAMVPLNDFAEGRYEAILDESGSIIVFYRMLEISKIYLGENQHLRTIALDNGFANASDWAEKSDAVLMTFVLTQIPRPDLESLVEITSEQLGTLPEEERADTLNLKKMGAALLALSQDDIDTFTPYAQLYTDALD